MSSRATFADFARAANRHLESPVPSSRNTRRLRPGELAAEISEYTAELRRIVKIMGSYLADFSPAAVHGQGTPWTTAAAEAKRAVRNASLSLPPVSRTSAAPARPALTSSLARDLRAAATAMSAGRDLLHTHFATTAEGERRNQSEWASLITAPAVSSALLAQVASWAGQVAVRGAHLTSPQARLRPQLSPGQANVIAACQWLTRLADTIDDVQREHPVSDIAIRKLPAIPASILQPRRLPAHAKTVSGLCQGIIETSKRVRRAATSAIPEAALPQVSEAVG
jgi:hypothetical protein